MPSAFAALVFLPLIWIYGKKIQCAAKGKGIRDILICLLSS